MWRRIFHKKIRNPALNSILPAYLKQILVLNPKENVENLEKIEKMRDFFSVIYVTKKCVIWHILKNYITNEMYL